MNTEVSCGYGGQMLFGSSSNRYSNSSVRSSISVTNPYKEIDELKRRVELLESQVADIHEVRDLPDEIIKSLIKSYSEPLPKDQAIYPSDIAFEYSLDPEKVEQIMDELVEEGYFE